MLNTQRTSFLKQALSVSGFAVLSGLILTSSMTQAQGTLRGASVNETITISFSELVLEEGESGILRAIIDCPENDCKTTELTLRYDPAIIQVDGIRPGPALTLSDDDQTITNAIDNTDGTVKFAYEAQADANAGQPTDAPLSGDNATFIKLDVTALQSGSSPISFDELSVISESSPNAEVVGVEGVVTVTGESSPAPVGSSLVCSGIEPLLIRADLPETAPDASVRLLPLGDVVLEDAATAAENAANPLVITSEVTVNSAILRAGPGTEYARLTSVAIGTKLQLDGRNSDGTWLRSSYEAMPVWISTQLVQPPSGLNSFDQLPVVEAVPLTPLQSLRLQTDTGSIPCGDFTPSMLLVQAPDDFEVMLYINNARLRVRGTVGLRNVFAADGSGLLLEVVALDGTAELENISLVRGEMSWQHLNESGLIAGGGWADPQRMGATERALFLPVENIDPQLLTRPITLPTQEELDAPVFSCASIVPAPNPGLRDGTNTFYWQGRVPGATYTVVVYDETGAVLGSGSTQATGSVPVNVAVNRASGGFNVTWRLFVRVGSRDVCALGPYSTVRPAS